MATIPRCTFLFATLSLLPAIPAWCAPTWTQPTPEELKMTSDPAAPDAAAVYLFREEIVDDKTHYHRVYARIKILTEKGKEEFSDVEIPYEGGVSDIRGVEGRTIHADGTVIPFSGKPYEKELVKTGNVKIMEKVFSMPDVQMGSIVEYRWELEYKDNYFIPPDWTVQQKVFVHRAHYHFIPVDLSAHRIAVTDALGKENLANGLLFYQNLPKGGAVRQGFDGFDVLVENVPALPEEEYSPPLESYAYRVVFYYSAAFSGGDFWQYEAKVWSKDVDRFANPSDAIRQAVAGIVSAGDTDDQKLRKIYAAVMTLENTRFSREHSAEENKAEGLRVKTAADIWQQKRGSDDEITRLFISMARAAGLKAWAMIVTERNRNLFNAGHLDWSQLEDEIAIVEVGGKEMYFDPGQRYCEYGKLHWMHTDATGFRQSAKGATQVTTPQAMYPENQVQRIAYVELGADGKVVGQLRISMTGAEALRWRQQALRSDEEDTKKAFDEDLQEVIADGVHVKTTHFLGLTDPETALMAVAELSGSLGTQTGKRVLIGGDFLEGRAKTPFAPQKRENPVDLRYPRVTQDDVTLKLPAGMTIESVPANTKFLMSNLAMYQSVYAGKGDEYHEIRQVTVGTPLYLTSEYPQLRDFFQKAGAQDQQQLVLTRSAEASAAGTAGKSE
ncbi:MAG: DUF3857 and transglutaminase domain-containing protein [Acidobacteriaceae bacterium]